MINVCKREKKVLKGKNLTLKKIHNLGFNRKERISKRGIKKCFNYLGANF